nr:glycosyltransferase [Salinisphaera sp.]
LIVSAFKSMPDKKLKIIGDGPERAKIEALAAGCPNIELLGYQPLNRLRKEMQNALGFVFAAEEDFGIMPVEAQACGTPVIAFGRGGALETVNGPDHSAPTGIFFGEQTAESVSRAVRQFCEHRDVFTSDNCVANAQRFSLEGFGDKIIKIVNSLVTNQ